MTIVGYSCPTMPDCSTEQNCCKLSPNCRRRVSAFLMQWCRRFRANRSFWTSFLRISMMSSSMSMLRSFVTVAVRWCCGWSRGQSPWLRWDSRVWHRIVSRSRSLCYWPFDIPCKCFETGKLNVSHHLSAIFLSSWYWRMLIARSSRIGAVE